MTADRDFKNVVRARMRKTGESYSAARAQLTRPRRGEMFESGTNAAGETVYRLTTRLQTPEKGWSGLAVPSEMLGRTGRAWLKGLLNDRPFWVSAQPMGDGNHWVTVNRQMRAEMGLVGDEEVEAVFVIAQGPPDISLPLELWSALEKDGAARGLFDAMSHSHRKEYIAWVEEAKRPETRERRARAAVERIVGAGKAGKAGPGMPEAIRAYVDAIPAEHRPLFDRLHRLVLEARPDAAVGLSYKMPAYKAGRHRLHLGAWKHGVSIYGWGADRDAGFIARHPDLLSGRGTIQLRPEDAAAINDDEFRDLARAALRD